MASTRLIAGVGALVFVIAATATVTYVVAKPNATALISPASVPLPKNTFVLTGILTIESGPSGVRSTGAGGTDSDCQGTGGYSDLTPGTAIKVSDRSGQVVATGSITSGQVRTTYFDGQNVVTGCQLGFTVNDVPDGLPSYVLTVSHRGDQFLTADQAHAPITLTIGGG
ncbi:hypothetical protein ACFXPA_17700 [Amycolatopsis sp. NPDC059090]|uniref:hypothetical protein n=1 Tax=unclassified Amycolatopsis TaxID=2618356 RepID=UPI00366BC617